MYNRTFILQFSTHHDVGYIHSVFNQEYACDVEEVFPGTYILNTDMSYSYMHRIIVLTWPEADLLFALTKRHCVRTLPLPAGQ